MRPSIQPTHNANNLMLNDSLCNTQENILLKESPTRVHNNNTSLDLDKLVLKVEDVSST